MRHVRDARLPRLHVPAARPLEPARAHYSPKTPKDAQRCASFVAVRSGDHLHGLLHAHGLQPQPAAQVQR
jgi:hypothetical protein